ncbi:hypothetical protein ZOSMA_266G00030 [Zostera marina]|uniref:Uncharacterized protein n=1 Tax=Zostera marina TaxID=29655 RepID=A0A0K9PGX5_ZOSMR|nr:hypothetical protein ZOSMA_266G00030 [Zostera marina]
MASSSSSICVQLTQKNLNSGNLPPPREVAQHGARRLWSATKLLGGSFNGKISCSSDSPTAITDAKKKKPVAKPPAKPLPELMEDEVIPSLRSTLEQQPEISQIDLSFCDNKLQGSFLKKDVAHFFWAFFPNGILTGPKGFSLSSYGSDMSTVEPFLIDERRITSKHIVFWVIKRLAAQGILPVWEQIES